MQQFPTSRQQLKLSTNFDNVETFELFNQINLSHWNVSPTSVTYWREESHTLSLYLNGGFNTYRAHKKSNKGSPGSICLMPQGQESRWHVNDNIELLHLYFPDLFFRQRIAHLLDVDARLVNINELDYEQDKVLVGLIRRYHQCITQGNPLLGEELVNEAFVRLAKKYSSLIFNSAVHGGLSRSQQKKINTFINDNISQKLTLELLASQLDLSAYHFARLFKNSFALSPANYITQLRIEKSKYLIKQNKSLTDIAIDIGFCQQSHFTSYFKKYTGYTPKQYSKIING